MQTNSPVEREKLLDALAEYEWRLRLAWNQEDQRFPIDPAPLTQVRHSKPLSELVYLAAWIVRRFIWIIDEDLTL